MVSTRPGRWLAATVHFLGLLSAARAISLSQFQAITPDQIPVDCLVVYTSTINGCLQTDFANTGSCSNKCMQGIQTKQSQLQVFCANLVVNPRSLLGLALSGNLLELLCPGQAAPPIPGFSTIPAATSTRTTVQAPPPPPTATVTTTTTRPTSTVDPKNPAPTQNTTPLATSSTRTAPSSTSAATSTPTTATPPTTSTAQADPAPTQVDPPENNGDGNDDAGSDNNGDSEPVEVIQQNGSPFANINFAAAGGSEQCAPRLWSVGLAFLFVGLALCS